MLSRSLDVLACPQCRGPLEFDGSVGDIVLEGSLRCRRDGESFPIVGGIPQLLRRDRVAAIRRFATEYSTVWRRDGWAATSPENLLGLPYRDPQGRFSEKWRVKARSLDALLRYLTGTRPGRVADLGAGTGWLSHHLASRSWVVFAVDALTDSSVGLAAASAFLLEGPYFERVCAELERLPFSDSALDLVVCNASLHYAASLKDTLSEIGRALRAGGSLVVMNSPVHPDEPSARRAESSFRAHLRRLGATETTTLNYHHFVSGELRTALRSAIGDVIEVPFDPGVLFRWKRGLKGRALRMHLASFPILVATKTGEQVVTGA